MTFTLTFEEARALLVSAVMVELQLVPGYVDDVAPGALPAHAAAIEKLRVACGLSHKQMDAMRADLVATIATNATKEAAGRATA